MEIRCEYCNRIFKFLFLLLVIYMSSISCVNVCPEAVFHNDMVHLLRPHSLITFLLLYLMWTLIGISAGSKVCTQCEGSGVNSVDHFNGQFKAGALCWLCRYEYRIIWDTLKLVTVRWYYHFSASNRINRMTFLFQAFL